MLRHFMYIAGMANMQEVVQVGWQQLRAYFTQTHVQSSIRGTGK